MWSLVSRVLTSRERKGQVAKAAPLARKQERWTRQQTYLPREYTQPAFDCRPAEYLLLVVRSIQSQEHRHGYDQKQKHAHFHQSQPRRLGKLSSTDAKAEELRQVPGEGEEDLEFSATITGWSVKIAHRYPPIGSKWCLFTIKVCSDRHLLNHCNYDGDESNKRKHSC